MFFARGLVPCNTGEPSQSFLRPDHLYVGANVTIHAHKFDLIGADEFTCAYMERCADQVGRTSVLSELCNLKYITNFTFKYHD